MYGLLKSTLTVLFKSSKLEEEIYHMLIQHECHIRMCTVFKLV